MTQLTRKQIEIQSRGKRILSVGFGLLDRGGLEAIRLDAIADEVGCTRGTLYNHYQNREEILVAMAQQAVEHRLSLFRHAVDQSQTSREKMTSICFASMVYADELPLDFAIEQAIRSETIWQRTSEARQKVFHENELACMALASKSIHQAINQDELPLPSDLTVEQMVERVCFGLWSLSFGGLNIQRSSPSLDQIGIRDVRSTIHHNCNMLLDSFRWQPLFDPSAYQIFLQRIGPPLTQHAADLQAEVIAYLDPNYQVSQFKTGTGISLNPNTEAHA